MPIDAADFDDLPGLGASLRSLVQTIRAARHRSGDGGRKVARRELLAIGRALLVVVGTIIDLLDD